MEHNFPKRYIVTSALPYANGPLHIGHLAGAYLPADVYVRYLRLTGADVQYICGSDENGAAITIRAKIDGVSPQEVVDKYHELIHRTFQQIGISFDIYHRTSSELHHQTASQFFKNLYDKGVFVEKESLQLYDEVYQQFLADRYISGTCPYCQNPNAYGDQCEQCGSSLSPSDLINPISKLSGQPPVLKATRHWYLPMQQYEAAIRQWLEATQEKEEWKKHVFAQCMSWLDTGLAERSMTRDLDWGVKVPLPNAEGKVLYVWLDAPIGYISATKALTPEWEKYWKDKDSKLVHFIGKDNIVFHCIIFPILLHAHGEYILPTNVPANQFMNLEGEKMSTSRNYAVWLHEYLERFVGMEDALRYTLIANMPETRDSDFSWRDFQTRNNSELVAILGNLVNRAMVLTHKFFDGTIPLIPTDTQHAAYAQAEELYDTLKAMPYELDGYVHKYEFRNALQTVMNVARAGNKFLTDTEPWKVAKTDLDRTAALLSIILELIAYLGVYIEPFLPFTAEKIKRQLQLTDEDVAAVLQGSYRVVAGKQLAATELLFNKIEDDLIAPEIARLESTKKPTSLDTAPTIEFAKEPIAYKPEITYDDFAKLDIRVGTIRAAERVPKADKLLKLQVDLGEEIRTVVSGIAEHHAPENIIGQQVLLLANLAPRKLRGIESNGMILMTESSGKLLFVAPNSPAQDGSSVS